MGNFSGHFFSGSFALFLSFWWMYKGFTSYIKSKLGNGQYQLRYSYPSQIRGREIYLEQIAKTVFTFLLLTGEVFISKFKYVDDTGSVIGSNSIMHLSYYLVYFLHSVVDLCMSCGVQGFPEGFDYITAALAFFWNGLSLYYHVQMRVIDVEYLIHVIPTSALYLVALAHFLSPLLPTTFLLDLLRNLGLLIFGTWFIGAGFILYKPGLQQHSPSSSFKLDRKANIMLIYTLFGFHICLAVVLILGVYQVCFRLQKRQTPKAYSYHQLQDETQQESPMLKLGT